MLLKQLIKYIFTLIFFSPLLFLSSSAYAQDKDTIQSSKKTNIFQYAMRLIKKKKGADTTAEQELLVTKSETAFLPYEGKGIRHIIINQYGFEKTFTDTVKRINYFGTNVLNKLHKDTRQWAIRENLIVKEKTPLSAYRLADNERYLRSLDYIRDARFVIKPVENNPDSIDIYVITKDLFSLNGELKNLSPGKFKGKFGDVNLFGAAQNLQANILIEKDRSPAFGLGVLYTKYNVVHTFIDGSAGYTTVNPDLLNGYNDEHAGYISLQRNLISQYSHLAGSITAGNYKSFNDYNRPEGYFFKYEYKTFDTWLGYNLSVNKFIKDRTRRDKQFISLRYSSTSFSEIPVQVENKLNFRFNSKQAILGQLNFFRQEYYKANYIYGFGTTEDIPYGYNIAVTTGWYKQSYLSRLYSGIDANFYTVYNRGDIVQYFMRAGSFWNNGHTQDAGILIGASAFSRLRVYNNIKVRQYIRFSYARQFNRTGLDPLSLNNPFGLRYFSSDSVRGNQRLSLHSETFTFINYKIFGFKFSPFAFADIAILTPENNLPSKSALYYGIGGGVRVRNENLVFRTAEFRIVYFPHKATDQSNSFKATGLINLAFRYNNNYVREPDIIQLNSDRDNNVF